MASPVHTRRAMHVIEVRRRYASHGDHRGVAALVILGSVATAVTAVLLVGLHPMAGVLVAVTTAWVGVKGHRQACHVSQRMQARAPVSRLLQGLPDDYWLLSGLLLSDHGASVDHVVVG